MVEDDPLVGKYLRTALQEHCYVVDLEEDGDRGYRLARENEYDLIILDNVLPGRHGEEICAALRERGCATPILVLSGQAETERKVGLLRRGADDYVTKPFSFDELAARIDALLRRSRVIEPQTLVAGDLVLEKERFGARRGTRRIHLTAKEYELLEYLMRNKGRVLSRGTLIEHVWDGAADIFSHTIETHVMRLRKKVDADEPVKLIHTVPGRGYMLDLAR